VPDLSRPYHLGTTAPDLGLPRQRSAGLLIPETAREASSPLDYAGGFLTHEELRGTRRRLEAIAAVVSRFRRKDMLAVLGLILQRLHAGEEWGLEAPRVAASWMVEPAASRCRNLLDQGRQLLTRHGALVLAKLALVHGGDETAEDAPELEPMLGPLFAAIHDRLGRRPSGDADAETVRVAGELTPLAAYLVANQLFNRSFDEANVLKAHHFLPCSMRRKRRTLKYDSGRNYILSRPDLQVHISERLSAGLFAPFTRLLARLERSETDRLHIATVDGHQAHRGDQEGKGDDGL